MIEAAAGYQPARGTELDALPFPSSELQEQFAEALVSIMRSDDAMRQPEDALVVALHDDVQLLGRPADVLPALQFLLHLTTQELGLCPRGNEFCPYPPHHSSVHPDVVNLVNEVRNWAPVEAATIAME